MSVLYGFALWLAVFLVGVMVITWIATAIKHGL